MKRFNIGDRVTSIWEPNKLGIVKSINTNFYSTPLYTIQYEDGNEYTNYEEVFKKVIDDKDALRYGKILTDDDFAKRIVDDSGWGLIRINYIRIRTISYENRIFYHKMVNGEVVEFKELTR